MAYATAEQLAYAVETRVTDGNEQFLTDCLDAAAEEIDRAVLVDAYPWVIEAIGAGEPPAIVVRTNVNRAVEWFKATDTFNGGVGTAETGALSAPSSGFERHAAVLRPLRKRLGIA